MQKRIHLQSERLAFPKIKVFFRPTPVFKITTTKLKIATWTWVFQDILSVVFEKVQFNIYLLTFAVAIHLQLKLFLAWSRKFENGCKY